MRCAIYTRKSHAEGLDAEFSSLDNQRDYCSTYIASQRGEGWIELPQRYDDGGVSGGTLDRPALHSLRADIAAGVVDMVVVYKIDRLSRSLRDFANLIAEFEAKGVTFVSVTQSFSTANAMGRLTLNVLLSFAQFEREMTAERLREFFYNSAKRGHWIVGKRPYGYRVVDKRLVIDDAEAAVVRWIYRHYCKVKSLRIVVEELKRRGFKNRNGTDYTDTILHKMLRNRVYRGERRGVDGKTHHPIVSEDLWQRTHQTLIDGQKGRRGRRPPAIKRTCLLAGKLQDAAGRRCIPTGRGLGNTYRYYADNTYKADKSRPVTRLKVDVVDQTVLDMLCRLTGIDAVPERTSQAARDLVDSLVAGAAIVDDRLTLHLKTGAVIDASIRNHRPAPTQKAWRLVSPAGERFRFVNLSLWLRTNGHHFDAADLLPFETSPGNCPAALGLSRLRPDQRTRPRRSWKHWTWDLAGQDSAKNVK